MQPDSRDDWNSLPHFSALRYRGDVEGTTLVWQARKVEEVQDAVISQWQKRRPSAAKPDWVKAIAQALSQDGLIWFQVDHTGVPKAFLDQREPSQWLTHMTKRDWQFMWSGLTNRGDGGFEAHWLPETLDVFLNHCSRKLPPTVLVPAIREIGPSGSDMVDLSGTGLIDRLLQIQIPDHDSRHELEIFDQVNDFLQYVTGKANAKIEVPHNREHVLVHIDGRVLPLASLGTGIHEVVMIAAFCLLNKDKIICIEEPEIHLHPVLQRKLVKYLEENTSNQYFIATHSPSFIDMPGASVFHVCNDCIQTYISPVLLRSDKRQLTDELGYKASDIIQANAVVWVEGPSDQIYIRHWLEAVAPELVEGIDFSIMFYGGRLLSHLTADADELDQFINLRSLNQNSAVVMDSDKTSAQKGINATKKRLIDEFEDHGFCWVTKGREIENYIDHDELQQAVEATHPKLYDRPLDGGPYAHALHFQKKKTRGKAKEEDREDVDLVHKSADKVAVARLINQNEVNLEVLDLREKIEGLADFLRKACL